MDGCGVDDAPWAMCVLWQDALFDWHFVGFRISIVALDPLDQEFIGARIVDSNASELSAFCWALMYIMQFRCDAKICYDSDFVANTANALWSSAGKSVQATTATALYTMLDTAISITTVHEYGHSGMPYNELCDSLCTFYRKTGRGHSAYENVPVRHCATTHQRAAQWAFILELSPEQQAQYPLFYVDDDVFLSTEACPIATHGMCLH